MTTKNLRRALAGVLRSDAGSLSARAAELRAEVADLESLRALLARRRGGGAEADRRGVGDDLLGRLVHYLGHAFGPRKPATIAVEMPAPHEEVLRTLRANREWFHEEPDGWTLQNLRRNGDGRAAAGVGGGGDAEDEA